MLTIDEKVGARGKKKVAIHIGEYIASREPMVISTLLGSCVAVCLYDWNRRIGGMNHILVTGEAKMGDLSAPARYGVNAMELLVNAMLQLGTRKENLLAKVFGGANVIPLQIEGKSVGTKISEFVLDFLRVEGINITAKDLGGDKSRRIFFHSDTGDVYLRRSHSMNSRKLMELENERIATWKDKALDDGNFILFDDTIRIGNADG
jgi:chemotaxis protein CheD